MLLAPFFQEQAAKPSGFRRLVVGTVVLLLLSIIMTLLLQILLDGLCYSKAFFIFIANVCFWIVISPLIIQLGKQPRHATTFIWTLTLCGVVLAGNQLFVRGTVDLLMYTSFRCTTASDSWLEYFLSNNLLINTLCYVSFVSYGFAKHTLQKEKSSAVLHNRSHFTDKVAVKEGNRLVYIDTDSIKWIEADNNCIVFHTAYKKIVSYQTLKSVEAVLDPQVFIRIHRSTIINRFLVKSITNLSTGGGLIQTTDDVQLRVSRTYKKNLQDLLSSH